MAEFPFSRHNTTRAKSYHPIILKQVFASLFFRSILLLLRTYENEGKEASTIIDLSIPVAHVKTIGKIFYEHQCLKLKGDFRISE